jgi:hypothetical protein
MEVKKIESIKLALMQVIELDNMEKDKSDFIVRSSIFLSLKDLEIVTKEDDLQYVVTDMYKTLLEKTLETRQNLDPVNYVGLWIKYDGEMFENSIKITTLKDIEIYSTTKINAILEFVKMTLPEL